MNLPPVIAALRKHKAGVFLIGIQIALTLAIVGNIIFIIGLRVQRIDRPTGLNEGDLFLITQRYVGTPATDDKKLDALQVSDLAALRQVPDVQSATPVTSLPLLRDINTQEVSTKPSQQSGITNVNVFFGDQQMLPTLGLQLAAGRDFTDADVSSQTSGDNLQPPVVIVTQALADKLFPNGDALGKAIYINTNASPSVIVGIVRQMLTANADGGDSYAYDSLLVPARMDSITTMYAVRAKPGRLQSAMSAAPKALFDLDPMRLIQPGGTYNMDGIHSFAEIRVWGYALDRFVVRALEIIGGVLLAITGVGMTGLTSFWVSQRRKQIGIRRALGARRVDIMRYFQLENLLIAGCGCIVGTALAIGINLALVRLFEMDRMPVLDIAVGAFAVLVLGQIAVFMPARRAANVPPVAATRGAS
jgi:putative ABC transport system permease protein